MSNGEWYLSSDGEYYNAGCYPDRDSAMNAGIEMYWRVARGEEKWNDLYPDGPDSLFPPTFWVGRKQEWWPCVDEDYMLDCVIEQADDYAGEFAEGWMDVSKEDREKLRGMLQEAFDKWIRETGNEPTFFMIECSEEIDPRDYEITGEA